MEKDTEDREMSQLIGGTLNIFGLKIDLSQLLSSQPEVRHRLEELREKLKQAGGQETLSDEEWRRGQTTIGGYLRTSGVLGEREYHIGTAGPSWGRPGQEKAAGPAEAVEPPVDLFHEAEEIVVVAEVPGVDLADFEFGIQGDLLSLSTKPSARRRYRKEVKLGSPVEGDSLQATCRNGILEVRLRKQTSGQSTVEHDHRD